jgi:hypothetical protein
MRSPAMRGRRRPGEHETADRAELARFRAWLVGRGYAALTARLWVSYVRRALARGVEGPEGVDAAFGCYGRTTRCGYRAALEEFGRFREAGRCGGSS